MSNVFVFRQPPAGFISEYFGGGKGGSTTTTNNVTQIPPEVLARYNAVNARAETVAEQPYQAYSKDPNAFVAPLSATQQAGIQNTNIMAGAAQPYYGSATEQLMQAQAGAQPGINAAYQNVGQAQNVGNQYANTAAQQYGAAQNIGSQYAGAAGQQYAGAQGAAAPYYQAATQGLGAGLNYANPLNQAAAQAAGGAFGAAAPYYQAATQGTQQALQGAQPYQGLATAAALSGAQGVGPGALQTQQYMNPYTQNVVQATQAALNQQQGQQLAQQQADAIKGGAFGSGRAASQRAQLQGQQSLAQSQAISPLLQQNYQQALAAAQQQQGVGLGAAQANRAAIQQAGQQLGALGQQTYGQQLGAANQMANLGQNLYGQGITGAQTLSQLGQTGYGQQLSASQQAQALGQGLYGQALGTGQALQGLGQQQYGQGLGTGQAQAALGQQQYGQGQATAQQLAALAQQGYGMGAGTSAALAGLGTNAQQAGLAGAQAQMQAGQAQQQTQQAGLQAMYNQFQQQQGFPYQQAQFLANIATGTGALSGNATSGTSTTTGGGGFFSDERLKENIQRVGETDDGQPIYRYNYKGDKNTQIGLLAQDVEKHHPEAVGLAGGYKTVNYKKATEDAVHKADGGAAGDAYSMGAPSQMLQENSGKGLGAVPRLPQMITGPQRIEAGADAANLAALRAPKATGYSLGTREGKEAELASLQSSLAQPPGPNGDLLGSGPQYLQSRIGTLQDWLNKNNSQGGLVGPQGGNFARGGLAEGGYMNPALAYYGPQQSQQGGVYGTQLQPLAQRQILQGTPMQAPQQRQQPDAVTAAMNMAKLVEMGNKARPDFLRSDADIAARKHTADALAAKEQQYIDWAKEKGYPLPSDKKVAEISPEDSLVVPEYAARGGLIGDRHHYSRGGINPYGGLGGGNDILGPILEEQGQQPQPQMMKAPEAPGQKPQQQSGGLGDVVSTGLKAKGIYDLGGKAYKGGEWAAGKLGLGGDTAMSATSAEALPGLAGAAPEAVTAAVPEVAAAAVPEALAGGAAAAEGLAGGAAAAEAAAAAAAATEAAAAGAGIAEALPFLAFLSDERAKHDIKKVGELYDGQPVYRFKYNGDDKTQIGLIAQKVEKGHPEAVGLAGGMKTVDYRRATDAAAKRGHYQTAGGVRPPEEGDAPVVVEDVPTEGGGDVESTRGDRITVVPMTTPPPARTPAPVDAAISKARAAQDTPSYLPNFSKIIPEGAKDTLSSENFWVPAIAGLGAMLASPNKTLAGAIGSGLVGGTGAYTELQKQGALQTKQRFELAKDLFKGPVEGDDKKLYWRHVPSGKLVPQEEYERLYSDFVRGSAGTPRSIAPSSDTPAVATARSVIAEEPPKPVKAATVPPASATAAAEAPAPAPVTPPVQPPAAGAPVQGEAPLKNKAQIKNEMLANPQAWADAPPEGNPILLRQKAAKMESEVAELRAKARRIATTMPENTTEGPRLTAEANQLDANRKEYIERSNQILNDAAELAYEDQKARSAGRTAQAVGQGKVPTTPSVKLPEGMTVAEAETNPDRLGDRIKFNMDNYAELKARGEIDEANKYLAAADKDRDRLATLIGTEFTTSSDTVYKINPQAPVYNVTKPKALPADYKSNIDPNTGAVVSKPISEFVGYPETGGHPVDPQLIGKKVIVKEGTDKKKTNSITQSNEAEKEFVNGAERAQEAIATTLKFSTAAKILEAKGANTTKAEMSNLARGLGLDLLADQILSAKDETAAFIALKTNVDQAIQQASAAFPRITQNEFAVTKKEATASIDAPFGASYSLAQTQMARALWQNALLSDWEKEKRMSGTTNFNAFRDVWQRAHPKGMFEESAARALGNFKGQDLPKKTEFTEGVVYVMPKNAGATKLGEAFIKKGLRPGDLFVMNGVNHQEGDFGEPTRVSPTEAYKVHLRAPVLTYGAR